MTFGERIRAESRMEGIQQGVQKTQVEIIERLLAENTELAFISKVTGLPLVEIERIQAKTFTA